MAELTSQHRAQQDTQAEAVSQRKGAAVLQDNRGKGAQTRALPDNRTVQLAPKPNNTGLPNQLKAGIESLSGMSMDHVKVHYNSAQPAQLNAHAYAQGSNIHLAPGQEKHLPHEAWHVVQQAQGRVKPTIQMKAGVPVNDDVGLEREADVMGRKALAPTAQLRGEPQGKFTPVIAGPIQRYKQVGTDDYNLVGESDSDQFFKTQSVEPKAIRQKDKGYKMAHEIKRTDARQGLLISEDNTLAINDTQDHAKEFYAAAGIVESSNKALKTAGSRVHLHKSGELKLQYSSVSLSKVIAEPAQKEENAAVAEFANLISHICIDMASGVMGSASHEAVFQQPGTMKQTVLNVTSKSDGGDPMINTLGSELISLPEKVDTDVVRANVLSKSSPELAGEAYGKYAHTKKGKKKARALGINEAAHPEVGEGYATYSLAASRDKQIDFLKTGQSREVLQSIWGYHYAAVVARSKEGSESVTLENYNRTDDVFTLLAKIIERQVNGNAGKFQDILNEVRPNKEDARHEISNKLARVLAVARNISMDKANNAVMKILKSYNASNSWFFKMQGKRKGQSFHKQQAASDAFVNPLTLRVRPRDTVREALRGSLVEWIRAIPKVPTSLGGLKAFEGWAEEVKTNSNAIMHAETVKQIKDAANLASINVITAGIRRSLLSMITECATTGSPILDKAMERFEAVGSVKKKAAFVVTQAQSCHWGIEEQIQGLSIFDTTHYMTYATAQSRVVDAMRYAEALAAYCLTRRHQK